MAQTTATAQISAQHWQNLTVTRKLAPEWIRLNVTSVDQKGASELLHMNAKSAGMWLEGCNGQGQFRPDKPWSNQQGKKAPKYRTAYQDHYDAILPTHPNDPNYWHDIEKLKELAYSIDGTPCLILTEGLFKAISGCSNDLPTIALCGVEMGLTPAKNHPQGKRFLVPSLEPYAQAGFGFIIAFDADAAHKKAVINAEIMLAYALEQYNVPVYSITGTWVEEAGKGMDDYIQNHGIEEFRKRLIDAEKTREKYQKLTEEGKDKKPPRSGELGKELAEKYKERWVYCSELNSWLIYELEEIGIWTMVSDDYLSHALLIELEAKGLDKYRTNSYMNNILGYLKDKLFLHRWEENNDRFLPFNNGVYELATGKLHEHSPGFRLTWKLPRDYSCIATDFPTIKEFLVRLSSGNSRDYHILLYFMAAVLRGRYDLQKFLYLIGTGGSGKTKYMELLALLVGEKNLTTHSLEELEDKHNIIDLFGKRLLALPDQAPISNKKNSNFKRLTGGDYLSGRRLFKDTASFLFQGLALITSNPPFIFPASAANWLNRRMLLVECNNVVSKQERDPQLLPKMKAELNALTNYLLTIPDESLTKVLQGIDEPDLTPSSWEYQCQSDGLAAWINEYLIEDIEGISRIGSDGNQWKNEDYDPKVSSLYASYCHYCRQTGRTPKTTQTFSSDLIEITHRLLGWNVEKKTKRYAGKPQKVICGVRLRTEDDAKYLTIEELLTRDVATCNSSVITEVTSQGSSEKSHQSTDTTSCYHRNPVKSKEEKINFSTSTSPLSENGGSEEEKSKSGEVQNALVNQPAVTSVTHPTSTAKNTSPPDSKPLSSNGNSVPSQEVAIDYGSYPARNSDNYRHKEKRANQCKEQMLACSTQAELDIFKANSGFSENEIKWVWNHLLTGAEKEKVKAASRSSQNDLFEQASKSAHTGLSEQVEVLEVYDMIWVKHERCIGQIMAWNEVSFCYEVEFNNGETKFYYPNQLEKYINQS